MLQIVCSVKMASDDAFFEKWELLLCESRCRIKNHITVNHIPWRGYHIIGPFSPVIAAVLSFWLIDQLSPVLHLFCSIFFPSLFCRYNNFLYQTTFYKIQPHCKPGGGVQ